LRDFHFEPAALEAAAFASGAATSRLNEPDIVVDNAVPAFDLRL